MAAIYKIIIFCPWIFANFILIEGLTQLAAILFALISASWPPFQLWTSQCNFEYLINFLTANLVNAIEIRALWANLPGFSLLFHGVHTPFLHRLKPFSEAVWLEVKPAVQMRATSLILDDMVLDKPFVRNVDLVHNMWLGKHHVKFKMINPGPIFSTDDERHLPCDYLIVGKRADRKSKNDRFGGLVEIARELGFQRESLLFDGCYRGLPILSGDRRPRVFVGSMA